MSLLYRGRCRAVKKMYRVPLINLRGNVYNESMVKRYPFKINHFSCVSHSFCHDQRPWGKQGTPACALFTMDAQA